MDILPSTSHDRERACLTISRRRFLRQGVFSLAAASAGSVVGPLPTSSREPGESASATLLLRYLLASCLYGYTSLEEILPEVRKTGAEAIDLWPREHGNQREQLDALGVERFEELLKQHGVHLGCLSRYDLGPFALADEIRLAQRLRCPVIVTGARGPTGLRNGELREAINGFVEKMKPTLALAEECGVTIAIENHSQSLIDSADSMRWLVEASRSPALSLTFAPYHLPQDPQLLAQLVTELGHRVAVFYMWQYGKGCLKPMPLEDELLQLPGKGPLDFRPILRALRDIRYAGYSSIFMHPYPRGRSIRESIPLVTAQISEARSYLDKCLQELGG